MVFSSSRNVPPWVRGGGDLPCRSLTCVREIALMSGSISSVCLTFFDLNAQRELFLGREHEQQEKGDERARTFRSQGLPQIAMTAGSDRALKVGGAM